MISVESNWTGTSCPTSARLRIKRHQTGEAPHGSKPSALATVVLLILRASRVESVKHVDVHLSRCQL